MYIGHGGGGRRACRLPGRVRNACSITRRASCLLSERTTRSGWRQDAELLVVHLVPENAGDWPLFGPDRRHGGQFELCS